MTRPTDRGAATLEFVAAIAVACLIIIGVVLVLPGAKVGAIAGSAVCSIKTWTHCPIETAGEVTTGTTPPGDNGDRRDQEGQTRDDRRGRGEDKSPDDPTVPGPESTGDSLGNPVPGTTAPEPDPPAWEPVDEGAGDYDSQRAWPWDHAKKVLVEAAANALSGKWPDASRNLSHYLGNTGEPLEQDINRLLDDVPEFKTKIDQVNTSLGEDAVARAQAMGADGPVTFPVSTDWQGFYVTPEMSQNWFYAMGGVSYNLTGQVTAYPPTSPGGPWRYQASTRVNVFDQYNWDGEKSTNIGPFEVTDEELARLHRQGLAQEYRNQGRSDTTTTEGTVP